MRRLELDLAGLDVGVDQVRQRGLGRLGADRALRVQVLGDGDLGLRVAEHAVVLGDAGDELGRVAGGGRGLVRAAGGGHGDGDGEDRGRRGGQPAEGEKRRRRASWRAPRRARWLRGRPCVRRAARAWTGTWVLRFVFSVRSRRGGRLALGDYARAGGARSRVKRAKRVSEGSAAGGKPCRTSSTTAISRGAARAQREEQVACGGEGLQREGEDAAGERTEGQRLGPAAAEQRRRRRARRRASPGRRTRPTGRRWRRSTASVSCGARGRGGRRGCRSRPCRRASSAARRCRSGPGPRSRGSSARPAGTRTRRAPGPPPPRAAAPAPTREASAGSGRAGRAAAPTHDRHVFRTLHKGSRHVIPKVV